MNHKRSMLSLNANAVYDAIQAHFLSALEGVEQDLIAVFQREILRNGTGRTKWREEAAAAIREISRELVDDAISLTVGLDDKLLSASEDLFVRVMVAIEGNQAGGTLTSKPGEQVYGKEIDGKHLSNAKTRHSLPQAFNQFGLPDEVADNVLTLVRVRFADALENALVTLPDEIFYENLIVGE